MYMLPLVPLHLVAFSHPILAVFIVPLVTVGHNIQYHCIVYTYARNKYGYERRPPFRWARRLFLISIAYLPLLFIALVANGLR